MVRAWGLRETGKPLSGARGGGPGIFLPLHWRGSPSTNLKGALRSPGGPAPQAGVETGGHSPAENWPGPPRAGGQGVRALPRPQGTQDPDLMGSTWWRGFLLEGHLHQKGFRAWTWLQNQVGGWRGGQPSGERRHISTLGTPPWDPESQDIPRDMHWETKRPLTHFTATLCSGTHTTPRACLCLTSFQSNTTAGSEPPSHQSLQLHGPFSTAPFAHL